NYLLHAGKRVVVIGGEADAEEIGTLRELFDNRVVFAINWPLRRLGALLVNAKFIGHDSGISHLAAAVGARCLILFGLTDPKIWAPRNANARVLVAPDGDLRQLTVAQLCDALELEGDGSGSPDLPAQCSDRLQSQNDLEYAEARTYPTKARCDYSFVYFSDK